MSEGKGSTIAVAPYALPGEKAEAMFMRLSKAYIVEGRSDAYRRSLICAVGLTPDEKAALLMRLVAMIQEDQRESLRLLRQSLEVSQYFVDQAKQ